MSDYLGNLVERSFAPTPALRPNIPSRFEPPPAKSPVDAPTEFDLPVDSRMAAIPQLPTEPLASSNRPIMNTPRERDNGSPAQFNGHPPADPAEKISPGKSNAAIFVAAEVVDRLPRIHLSTADNPPALTRQTDAKSDFPPDFRLRPASAGKSLRSDTARPVASSARKENGKTSPLENSAPPSAVHVTIGRLEIKATLPPAAPPRAASGKNPGLTLENYLQRRTKGGRDE